MNDREVGFVVGFLFGAFVVGLFVAELVVRDYPGAGLC